MLAPLPALDAADMHLGADPSLLTDELRATIVSQIRAHPRSLQTNIGPSEIGTPCTRKLGYKVTHTVPVVSHAAWRPVIGTATHAWLAEAFVMSKLPDGRPRYLVETRVEVGEIDGEPITGTADLYDRVTGSVVDWKVVGPTSLRAARSTVKPSQHVQVQLYGTGFVRRGLPVERVGIAHLPTGGELHEMVVQWFDYDPQVGIDALARADGIAYALRTLGPGMFSALPTADDYCASCSWLDTRSSNAARACPGHTTLVAQAKAPTVQAEFVL